MNDRYAYDRWLALEPDESLYEDVPESEEQKEEAMSETEREHQLLREEQELDARISDEIHRLGGRIQVWDWRRNQWVWESDSALRKARARLKKEA
jgi:hypothetical protein